MASLDLATLEIIEGLRDRRETLARRLGKVERDRRRAAGALPADFEEQVVERENDDVLDALDEREREELAHIERALDRVTAGCFGICDDCGQDVDPRRLESLPWAERCVKCAEATE